MGGLTTLKSDNTGSVTAIDGITAYSVTVTLQSRRAGAKADYAMTSQNFKDANDYKGKATSGNFQNGANTAGNPSNLPSGAPNIGSVGAAASNTGAAATSGAARASYGFGIAALIAFLFAQLC